MIKIYLDSLLFIVSMVNFIRIFDLFWFSIKFSKIMCFFVYFVNFLCDKLNVVFNIFGSFQIDYDSILNFEYFEYLKVVELFEIIIIIVLEILTLIFNIIRN